eukprot:jgi/Mesen1/7062/ME000369S06385
MNGHHPHHHRSSSVSSIASFVSSSPASATPSQAAINDEFTGLMEKAYHKFARLRELPPYGRKKWDLYFLKAFNIYSKLWKFQQEYRSRLMELGLKRWEIGEVASRIGQLYYNYYLRTSEATFLFEAYIFYEAISSREYLKEGARSDCALANKQLRYGARFVIVCLLLNRRETVRRLLRQLRLLVEEYARTYQAADAREWKFVLQEIMRFMKADAACEGTRSLRYSLLLDPAPGALPLVASMGRGSTPLKLQEAILTSYHPNEVKFSELTLDTFRMLQAVEYEPSGSYARAKDGTISCAAPGGMNGGPPPARIGGVEDNLLDPNLPPNPHKYILYRPNVPKLLLVLATAVEELPPDSALLLYISASGGLHLGPLTPGRPEASSSPLHTPTPAAQASSTSGAPPGGTFPIAGPGNSPTAFKHANGAAKDRFQPPHSHPHSRRDASNAGEGPAEAHARGGSFESSDPASSSAGTSPGSPQAGKGGAHGGGLRAPGGSEAGGPSDPWNGGPAGPGVWLGAKKDAGKEPSTNLLESNYLHASDLLPFTRRPMFLIVDSDNSSAFEVLVHPFLLLLKVLLGNERGAPCAMLLSPLVQPADELGASAKPEYGSGSVGGNLFTFFLTAPLLALCRLIGLQVHSLEPAVCESTDKQLSMILSGWGAALAAVPKLDPSWGCLLSDLFLRQFILRFVLCRAALALHSSYGEQADHLPRCFPPLPSEMDPSSEIIASGICQLAASLGGDHQFLAPEPTPSTAGRRTPQEDEERDRRVGQSLSEAHGGGSPDHGGAGGAPDTGRARRVGFISAGGNTETRRSSMRRSSSSTALAAAFEDLKEAAQAIDAITTPPSGEGQGQERNEGLLFSEERLTPPRSERTPPSQRARALDTSSLLRPPGKLGSLPLAAQQKAPKGDGGLLRAPARLPTQLPDNRNIGRYETRLLAGGTKREMERQQQQQQTAASAAQAQNLGQAAHGAGEEKSNESPQLSRGGRSAGEWAPDRHQAGEPDASRWRSAEHPGGAGAGVGAETKGILKGVLKKPGGGGSGGRLDKMEWAPHVPASQNHGEGEPATGLGRDTLQLRKSRSGGEERALRADNDPRSLSAERREERTYDRSYTIKGLESESLAESLAAADDDENLASRDLRRSVTIHGESVGSSQQPPMEGRFSKARTYVDGYSENAEAGRDGRSNPGEVFARLTRGSSASKVLDSNPGRKWMWNANKSQKESSAASLGLPARHRSLEKEEKEEKDGKMVRTVKSFEKSFDTGIKKLLWRNSSGKKEELGEEPKWPQVKKVTTAAAAQEPDDDESSYYTPPVHHPYQAEAGVREGRERRSQSVPPRREPDMEYPNASVLAERMGKVRFWDESASNKANGELAKLRSGVVRVAKALETEAADDSMNNLMMPMMTSGVEMPLYNSWDLGRNSKSSHAAPLKQPESGSTRAAGGAKLSAQLNRQGIANESQRSSVYAQKGVKAPPSKWDSGQTKW